MNKEKIDKDKILALIYKYEIRAVSRFDNIIMNFIDELYKEVKERFE